MVASSAKVGDPKKGTAKHEVGGRKEHGLWNYFASRHIQDSLRGLFMTMTM